MSLIITEESHLDHHLTKQHRKMILERFADRDGFFIETFDIPQPLRRLPCQLYGPLMGDAPVPESEVTYRKRLPREYESRLINRHRRWSRQMTVIAGPTNDAPCVLYTAYGGPCAPREPNDPALPESERDASIAFWSEHALTCRQSMGGGPVDPPTTED